MRSSFVLGVRRSTRQNRGEVRGRLGNIMLIRGTAERTGICRGGRESRFRDHPSRKLRNLTDSTGDFGSLDLMPYLASVE